MEQLSNANDYETKLGEDLRDVTKRWNWMHKTYLVLHLSLVFTSVVLSGVVIPYAAYYKLQGVAFVSRLVVAMIIGFQNAFATGSRWAFYSGIVADLQAVKFEFRRATSGPDRQKVTEELEGLSTKVAQINTRAYVQVPRGQGADVAGRAESS
jgi:FtsH-binding integral membrane protein